MRHLCRAFAIALSSLCMAVGCGRPMAHGALDARTASPAWEPLGATALDRAARERRIVLLSIQAQWCHWCHVMNEVTYRDPRVLALIEERFVAVREEADRRPDLAERYAEQGWPATVLLAPDGSEIVALRGHREPRVLERILRAVIDDLDRGRPLGSSLDRRSIAAPEEAPSSDLEALRVDLVAQLDGLYDAREEGWGTPQKYPFAGPVLHALFRARARGELEWRERALRTLDRHARLIDPIWGGMYQYSEQGDWAHPHFEKIASVQAAALETFAAAHRDTGDPRWLAHAADIVRYLEAFARTPDGAFLASQDADLRTDARVVLGGEYYALGDAERRALGIPRIDERVYAETNGRLAAALATLGAAAGDPHPVELAERALSEVMRTHARDDGLFDHEVGAQRALAHLGDQVSIARAMLALHQATSEPVWLARARALVSAIARSLHDTDRGGFFAHTLDPDARGVLASRRRPPRENAELAVVLLSLARLSEDEALHALATEALRAVSARTELRAMGRKVGEMLMALELAMGGIALVHVVGPRDDPRTEALLSAARRWGDPRALVDHAAPGQGRYPYPGEPAAFLCTTTACAPPVMRGDELAARADAFLAAR